MLHLSFAAPAHSFSGTDYSVKVRTGLAGNHTWSGTPDWGTWGSAQKFKTSGELRHAGSGSSTAQACKGSKKKKNRDAAFAAMFSRQSDEGQADEEEEGELPFGGLGDFCNVGGCDVGGLL
jgi:hypothetical protein